MIESMRRDEGSKHEPRAEPATGIQCDYRFEDRATGDHDDCSKTRGICPVCRRCGTHCPGHSGLLPHLTKKSEE
jgi:hypothetical protein